MHILYRSRRALAGIIGGATVRDLSRTPTEGEGAGDHLGRDRGGGRPDHRPHRAIPGLYRPDWLLRMVGPPALPSPEARPGRSPISSTLLRLAPFGGRTASSRPLREWAGPCRTDQGGPAVSARCLKVSKGCAELYRGFAPARRGVAVVGFGGGALVGSDEGP